MAYIEMFMPLFEDNILVYIIIMFLYTIGLFQLFPELCNFSSYLLSGIFIKLHLGTFICKLYLVKT